MRKALAILLFTLTLSFSAFAVQVVLQPEVAEAATPTRTERRIVAAINTERTERGLARLRFRTPLIRAARWQSADMAARDVLSHTSGNGWTVGDRARHFGYRVSGYSVWTVGETIASATAGTGYATPKAIVALWMQSDSHREVLLTARFRDVGVGVRNSSDGTRYFTVDFGRRID